MTQTSDQPTPVTVIKPNLAPRDGVDVLVVVGVGCLQVFALFILPSIVIGLIARSFLAVGCAFFALYGLWLLLSVTRMELSPEGIRFVRVLGTPKFVRWSEVSSIVPASPREVVIHGWLWPPFPAREMTFSLSANGHYAIRFNGRTTYYPPAEPHEFERLVAQHMSAPNTDRA